MEVLRGLESLPADHEPSAITIGFFDGVHRGHQAVFRRTMEIATDRKLCPVAITFDRHPREVLTPGKEPLLLTTLDRKAELIGELGLHELVVLEFTEDVSRWSPAEFVRRVLGEGLNAHHAVIGSNFTFGYKAMGNLEVLTGLGRAHGFSVEGVELLQVEGRPVSSSSIREALSEGHLAWPAAALGRTFAVDGRVVGGAGRGAGMGYPTANLEVSPRMQLPGRGIYAGRGVLADGSAHVAAIDVGTNPTFGDEPLRVEAFLLDFDGNLLGQAISIEFWERLRDEVRFDSAQELARQIEQDVHRTREIVQAEPAPAAFDPP
jgi:riboflavin kinase/FMN adenylyltransferase